MMRRVAVMMTTVNMHKVEERSMVSLSFFSSELAVAVSADKHSKKAFGSRVECEDSSTYATANMVI